MNNIYKEALKSLLRSFYNTDDYPDGNVYNAFQALEKHYNIHLVAKIQKILGEFYDKKLKKGRNLSAYITEMENLREKLKYLILLSPCLINHLFYVFATVCDALTLDFQCLDDTFCRLLRLI
jgi:hypothetical protein